MTICDSLSSEERQLNELNSYMVDNENPYYVPLATGPIQRISNTLERRLRISMNVDLFQLMTIVLEILSLVVSW